jgi:hypothetical protein
MVSRALAGDTEPKMKFESLAAIAAPLGGYTTRTSGDCPSAEPRPTSSENSALILGQTIAGS